MRCHNWNTRACTSVVATSRDGTMDHGSMDRTEDTEKVRNLRDRTAGVRPVSATVQLLPPDPMERAFPARGFRLRQRLETATQLPRSLSNQSSGRWLPRPSVRPWRPVPCVSTRKPKLPPRLPPPPQLLSAHAPPSSPLLLLLLPILSHPSTNPPDCLITLAPAPWAAAPRATAHSRTTSPPTLLRSRRPSTTTTTPPSPSSSNRPHPHLHVLLLRRHTALLPPPRPPPPQPPPVRCRPTSAAC